MNKKNVIKKSKVETDKDRMMLRMSVRGRMAYQEMRKDYFNKLGIKSDGTPQKNSRIQSILSAWDRDTLFGFAMEAKRNEEEMAKTLAVVTKRFPICDWMKEEIKGLGDIGAAWIVGEFDIYKADTVSKMWQYAGLNPGLVRGKKRVKVDAYKLEMGEIVKEVRHDNRVVAYIVLTDTMIPGDKLTEGFISPFNMKLRTALLGVIGINLFKAGLRGEDVSDEEYEALPETYRRIKGNRKQRVFGITKEVRTYLNYKNRLAHSSNKVREYRNKRWVMVEWKDAYPGHRNSAAIRYMIKMMLVDVYKKWRELEGLLVRPSFQEEKLGHIHNAENVAAM